MSGRKSGQYANLWLVFGSTGNGYTECHLNPGGDANVSCRKLAIRQLVSTKGDGSPELARKEGRSTRIFIRVEIILDPHFIDWSGFFKDCFSRS